MLIRLLPILLIAVLGLSACENGAKSPVTSTLITNALIFDGTGAEPLHDAIHKMTGRAADTLGLKERGRLAVGHFADVVVFDPQTIMDHATMSNPTAMSTGIQSVWVNGMLVFDAGETTQIYAGQVLSRR